MDFKGVGVFFNQMVDLERIAGLAQAGKIQWISPLMAPDQSSVQLNRKVWDEWRKRMPNVPFVPWFWCDDPVVDSARIDWILSTYKSDGIMLNCEKSYEGTGKWKGQQLMDLLRPKWGGFPKCLSFASFAETQNMDFRAFQLAGCVFAPQAYFNEMPACTPKALYDSTVKPMQLHVGRDYRMKPTGLPVRWGRVVAWDGGSWCTIKDLKAARPFKVKVVPKVAGNYHYMVIATDRQYYDYATGQVSAGIITGFQDRELVFPTVASYGNYPCAPADLTASLKKLPNLKGASLYLGDTTQSAHVEAVWNGIN